MKLLFRVLFSVLAVAGFSSCGNGHNGSGNQSPALKTSLLLSEAMASEGCLSIPRLYSGLRELAPSMRVTIVPTQLTFSSKNTIRPAFRNLVAYGTLKIQYEPFADFQDLPAATQESCTKVVITRANGEDKAFDVKKSGPDSLEAEADDGEAMEYMWLSPHRLRETRRYVAYDLPCQSEKVPVLVSVTRVLDWGGGGMPVVLPASEGDLAIDKNLLALAAEAVGVDVNTLYVKDPDGGTSVDVGKVNSLSDLSPRPELVACGRAQVPQPQPEPAPDPGTTPSPTPDNPAPNTPSPAPSDPAPAPAPAPDDGTAGPTAGHRHHRGR